MKFPHKTAGIWLRSCLIASLAVSSLPAVAADAAVEATREADALKSAPAVVKRTVDKAIGYFGLKEPVVEVIGSGYRNITLRANKDIAASNTHAPTYVQLTFEEESSKLRQLETGWKTEPKSGRPDPQKAVSEAAAFAEEIVGKTYTAGLQGTLLPNNLFEVPLYPVVNDIPVQKAAGSIVVDASGRLRSFMKRDSKVDERTLPSTSGIQSRERALEALGDQLHMELAYDDEQELYQYQAFPYGWVDAKTGEAAAPPYKYDDTSITVGAANRKQPTALTADEAKTMAQDFFGASPDQLKTSSRRESHPNEAPLSIYTLQDDRRSIVVRTDEKTGALLQADLELAKPSNSIRATEGDIKAIAQRFIERHVPLSDGEYLLRGHYSAKSTTVWDTSQSVPLEYVLELYPKLNGVRTAKPIVTITFDPDEGIMSSVNIRAYTPRAVVAPTFISVEEAKKQWLHALQLELNYVYPTSTQKQADQPILAYVPAFAADARYVNAVSGKVGSQ